ncbi:uncharacterized protein N7511_001753 [Penicillium nucicola]|uniref:uncharacterized protein n=1 Tax=Penicillium nucicola TaxID=1850975 RepID=UPI002544EF6E|nr:uncharacterized protein N7511_008343 [Penicillium nucicola]XP_056988151.1 uncharacterized protein N7511_003567 [Penicillium nucicola]XP_056989884.1 uncharacterized protein N7511_001726 [Penicillium nucicola]XP_056989911.1 uncharacterized protein N7511_001753 [Penicillium nucicola]KAJ5751378.1 hypothetical protein N7511_008343 [Penicillium nucicola]KAJ5771516.1 hypothetical protein N7511_003567 [Penicillium nucicola]KAJ5776715.1 hypothetical protein N7511_001726 [Penicillium nucicola]KAJ57
MTLKWLKDSSQGASAQDETDSGVSPAAVHEPIQSDMKKMERNALPPFSSKCPVTDEIPRLDQT